MQQTASPSPPSTDWYGVAQYPQDSTLSTHRFVFPGQTRPPLRKSPPPPPINLDDCKSVISTTRTNTSAHSSSSGSSAFVFTSSKTVRALQHAEVQTQPPSSPTSPASPGASANTQLTRHIRQRPSLTQAQLAKHSDGAVDARSMLGPNMRAAGFVHLSQAVSPLHGPVSPLTASPPSTPEMAGGIPTPHDPPPFPPIMFVNPAVVATTAMWEYQRGMTWPIGNREIAGVSVGERVSGENSVGVESSAFSSGSRSASVVSSIAAPILPPQTVLSSSASSNLVTSPSSSLSVQSRGKEKGKAIALDAGLNEYPFPRTFSTAPSRASTASQTSSSVATSPIIITPSFSSTSRTTSRTSTSPMISTPSFTSSSSSRRSHHSSHSHAHPADKEKAKTREGHKQAHSSSSTYAKRHAQTLSFTELCDVSPFAWTTHSDNFIPLSPIRSRSRSCAELSIAPTLSLNDRDRARERAARTSVPRPSKENAKQREGDVVDAKNVEVGSKESDESELERRNPLKAKVREPEQFSGKDLPPKMRSRWSRDKTSPQAHADGDRGRDVHGKALAGADADREHLNALVHAHRERERQLLKQQKRARAKEKSILGEAQSDTEVAVDLTLPHPAQ
ncbi:hypothetical protein AcV7_007938 [Taiwanofungus camphoratus]|nr:hypothetical protein AcV7_007938 [Antrodia cinnamomea]